MTRPIEPRLYSSQGRPESARNLLQRTFLQVVKAHGQSQRAWESPNRLLQIGMPPLLSGRIFFIRRRRLREKLDLRAAVPPDQVDQSAFRDAKQPTTESRRIANLADVRHRMQQRVLHQVLRFVETRRVAQRPSTKRVGVEKQILRNKCARLGGLRNTVHRP